MCCATVGFYVLAKQEMQQKIKNATKNTLREVRSFFAQAVSFGDEEGFRNIYGATSCGNFGYDHITVKIRHPVRSVKLSKVGLG